MKRYIICLLSFIVSVSFAKGTSVDWMNAGPKLGKVSSSFEVPIKRLGTKMYIEVELGNKLRRFVVDTGSPSMIDSTLAKELGLPVVGKSKGIDAHGTVIESNIVQANLGIGDVAFQSVPMMTADFSGTEATRFFIGDGVIGSELLPLGIWQFDLKDEVLRFNTNLNNLLHVEDGKKVKLYQFGYPYMPIFDVKFAKHARSKALFDTGSPTYFAISQADYHGAKKESAIGKVLLGYGSPGSSLGGQAPSSEQRQVEIKKLAIDQLKLGRVVAIQRELSPSLIGASMLERFIITLDSRSGSAYFKEYSQKAYLQPSFGFTLAFDQQISIALVWDKSPAKLAGLQAGMKLISVNGVKTELTSQGIERVMKAMAAKEIELEWESGSTTLNKVLPTFNK